MLLYWAGTPNQHRQANRLYRRMRIGAAQRELSRSNGERFLAPGYSCVSHAYWLRRYFNTVLPNGAPFDTRAMTVCGRSGKSARLQQRMGYIWFDVWTTRDR